MKITGKIKPIFTEEGFSQGFRLKVYFKEEGQWFHRSYTKTLINLWRDIETTREDLVDKTLEYLSDEEGLIEIAKDIVLFYYKDRERENKGSIKEKRIRELIKGIEEKKISFEMEMK